VNQKAVVVYPSSINVIGKALTDCVDENHPEFPLDCYSAHKGLAEKYYRLYHAYYGIRTVVLRLANLFGPYGKGHSEYGFINYFIHCAQEGRPLTVYGKGEQIRNVVFVEDAVDLLWQSAFCQALYGGVYFAPGPFYYSVCHIAEKVAQIFKKSKVQFVDWPTERLHMEIGNMTLSNEKLRARTGWVPRWDLEAGLMKTKSLAGQRLEEVKR